MCTVIQNFLVHFLITEVPEAAQKHENQHTFSVENMLVGA